MPIRLVVIVLVLAHFALGEAMPAFHLASASGPLAIDSANHVAGLPCTFRQSSAPIDHGIVVRSVLRCSDTATFHDGLRLSFQQPWDSAFSRNHSQTPFRHIPSNAKTRYAHLQQFLKFHLGSDSVLYVLRNPFQAIWELDSTGGASQSLHLFPALPDNSFTSNGSTPSTLFPGDSIVREVEIHLDGKTAPRPYLSEHAYGATSAITAYFDELPNRDNWKPVANDSTTTASSHRFLVRLLQDHPHMRLGYVLLLDRILYRRLAFIPEWKTRTFTAVPDSIRPWSGKQALALYPSRVLPASISTMVYPDTETRFIAKIAHKERGSAALRIELRGTGADSDSVYQSWTPPRNLGAWRVDSTRLSSPRRVPMELRLTATGDSGVALADNVLLYTDHAFLVQNSGFEDGAWSFFWVSDTNRRWLDFHAQEHLLTYAPPEYREFLQRLGSPTSPNEWERRMSMGMHGYHHSPSLMRPDPEHEFNDYNPHQDSTTVGRIFAELDSLQIPSRSRKFWRSPGFQYTSSLVPLLIDRGVQFFDPGWFWLWNRDASRFFFLRRGPNVTWGTGLAWWGDQDSVGNDELVRYPIDSTLTAGHLAHIGGHPEMVFRSGEASYRKLDTMFTRLESAYPGMVFVHPQDWAQYATKVQELRLEAAAPGTLQIHDSIPRGLTLFLDSVAADSAHPLVLLVNQRALRGKTIGQRTVFVYDTLGMEPTAGVMRSKASKPRLKLAKPCHALNGQVSDPRRGILCQ